MLSDPIKFFDGLARGIVLTFYDVVLLSLASLAFPFVRRTRRFWPLVLRINRRVSSLTLLLIWTFFFSTLTANDLPDLAARIAANQGTGSRPIQIIVAALVATIAIDLGLRAGCAWIRSRRRRELFTELLRIACAGTFFVACIVMLLGKNDWLFRRLASLLDQTIPMIPNAIWTLYVPGLSICMLLARGAGIRAGRRRIVLTMTAALIVPTIIVGAPAVAGLVTLARLQPLLERREPVKVVQSNTECVVTPAAPAKLNVTTFLRLDSDVEKSAVLPIDKLVIERPPGQDKGTTAIGSLKDVGGTLVLGGGSYTRFDLVADFLPEDNDDLVKRPPFPCSIAIRGEGLFGLPLSLSDQTVQRWR